MDDSKQDQLRAFLLRKLPKVVKDMSLYVIGDFQCFVAAMFSIISAVTNCIAVFVITVCSVYEGTSGFIVCMIRWLRAVVHFDYKGSLMWTIALPRECYRRCKEEIRKYIWLPIASSLKTRINRISHASHARLREIALYARGLRRLGRRLFLLASDYAPGGQTTVTFFLVSISFVLFLKIVTIVGVLVQIAQVVYNIASFLLHPFRLTLQGILSVLYFLIQVIDILSRAVLHGFVSIFTAVATFTWLNVASILSGLYQSWQNFADLNSAIAKFVWTRGYFLSEKFFFVFLPFMLKASYHLAAISFYISSVAYENVFVANVTPVDKFVYFTPAGLGSCILVLWAMLLAFWFRNTLCETSFSEIDDKDCAIAKTVQKIDGHIRRSSQVPICTDYILDKCRRGNKCKNHHCPLPYHWQYRQSLDGWKSFNAQDNDRMEELFSDPSKDIVNAPEIEAGFESYRRESTDGLSVLGYTITIDFDHMLMFLTLPESQDTLIRQLRRLSTFDGSVDPYGRISMSWTWYWEEKGNVWRTYDKDCSERKLQGVIEEAYLDYLKQGKERGKFRFATAEHEYTLFFCPTEMYQVNSKTNTKRRVRRRPGKVISNEDVENLKWMYGDSAYKEKVLRLLRAEKQYFPSHWSSMPPKSEYYRAHVERSTGEFKELKKLFRMTMNDYDVLIENIDRVQNLFMMEKYCRKKEKMIQSRKTVNERRLFHGTSPDVVKAICKYNFDWRLSGKHATRFGEGSYFARDACYSHHYAKTDAHGFRHVFVAKVLVGSFTKGHASYRKPPPKFPSDPESDLYDSCVNEQSNPSVFVVFDTDQLYPEYIITYSIFSKLDYQY